MSRNLPTTDKARRFLSLNPTYFGTRHGVDLYEHPTRGDEAPIFAITADGRVKETQHWEMPIAEECCDLLDL